MNALAETLQNYIKATYEVGYIPDKPPIETSTTTTSILVDGRNFINFASNNYLSLANHPDVKTAAIEAIGKYGLGSGASRWMSGFSQMHNKLEEMIAEFKGCEKGVIFSSGMLANFGVVTQVLRPALLPVLLARGYRFFNGETKAIFFDEANHASLYDACRLSKGRGVKKYLYKRGDVDQLSAKLKKSKEKFKVIITDGIFSDFGNIAPLKEIYSLAVKHGALLIVDDAHATGVLGKNGAGTFEYCGIKDAVKEGSVIITGTFSKAIGGEGGFVVGNANLIELFRTSRQFIFNTAMPPAVAAGCIASLKIIKREPERRGRLKRLCDYMRKKLDENGFDYLGSPSQIIPILIGNEDRAERITIRMLEEGIYIPCFKYPAAPLNRAIFRASLMVNHTEEQIDHLIERLKFHMDNDRQ